MKRRLLQKLVVVAMIIFANGCTVQSQLVEGAYTTNIEEEIPYYLYFPEDYQKRPNETFGLLLFLHGGGESGNAKEKIKQSGPPKLLVEGKQFPFLVLAPQNQYAKRWWNVHAVVKLLDAIIEEYRVDANRIYLSGLSRGGSAAWDMAVQYPEKFVALAVVCGMTPVPYAHWLDKNLAIWVFHGDEDQVIPVSESDEMVKKLKELDYNVQYTRYVGVAHNSWEKAYLTEDLYQWMHKQKRE